MPPPVRVSVLIAFGAVCDNVYENDIDGAAGFAACGCSGSQTFVERPRPSIAIVVVDPLGSTIFVFAPVVGSSVVTVCQENGAAFVSVVDSRGRAVAGV